MRICLYVLVADAPEIDDERFKALGNDHRRAILRLVRDEPQPAGRIAEQLGISQPSASQHLAVLRDARLVTVRVDGRRRWYGADLEALAEVRAFFDEYWSSAADRLAAAAERASVARREAS
jgi:DNA-binding transcriptional ArsR family regulator